MTELDPSVARQPVSRRSAIAATAWSLPVLAIAVAAPATASSVLPELTLRTPQPQPAGALLFRVTVPSAQLPLPAATTLVLQRTSATGSISSASFVGTWNYSWPSSDLIQFFPTATVATTSDFTINLTGPAAWTLTLTIPNGPTLTQYVTVIGPV